MESFLRYRVTVEFTVPAGNAGQIQAILHSLEKLAEIKVINAVRVRAKGTNDPGPAIYV